MKHPTGQVTTTSDAPAKTDALDVWVLCRDRLDFLWLESLLGMRQDQREVRARWCADPSEVEHCLKRLPCHLIVCDTAFAPDQATRFTESLGQLLNTPVPIIMVGADDESSYLDSAFSSGASDYLCKQHLTPWALEKSVRFVIACHHEEQQEARRMTLHALRGVVDRHLFFDRLEHALKRARRTKGLVGLMTLNIDNFQSINETFGYDGGDQLLRTVAIRLGRTMRESDSIARLAGDEFAVILDNIDSFYACITIAEKLTDLFQAPFLIKGEPTRITVSIGIACFPETAQNSQDLVKFSNRAMQKAKAEHGNVYQYYNQALNQKLTTILKLEADFRKAIRHGELRLFYQPRIDIVNTTLIGMESLVRWEHPEFGLLPPDEFVPMAERTGMIVPMGYWVISQACADMVQLRRAGFENLLCSVNLSFRQFQDRKLAETLLRILLNSGVSPSNIELELTETAMMQDVEMTSKCLQELASLGISLALDDFGTGFSSFSHLHKLPLSTLKIDKSFIDELGKSQDSEKIVTAVIQLAHTLGMNVVAEGVEQEDQLSFLRDAHCDHVQGFYFGTPAPYDQFLGYLNRFYPEDDVHIR